ncbi:glutaredoxin-C7-like [Phragmites australis]|uniref:glutaredoxin-C7-like n=1 Tax=Phragmites australis TaxID=29695 RepID=UPI002D7883B6|nr:glutaredoxin-C7-like [Phragmites australis]
MTPLTSSSLTTRHTPPLQVSSTPTNTATRAHLHMQGGGGGGVSCAVAGEAPSPGGVHLRVGGGLLGLTIDPAGDVEAPEERIGRLVRESPVVIFARRGCCMCHVMRRLLEAVGTHATVIELEEAAEEAAASAAAAAAVPALFVGGAPVGGLDGLMGLHLSGLLVPRLREVGALCG